ncbi:MAG: serine/threonine protein kinase [Myxococcales bacterium]|jgi:serine/threonine-protein kinase|nr:serine/threonine protein kinase [Myxococcales bacterium]
MSPRPLTYPDSVFVGRTIGAKYRVTRVLGVGGMGVVCEARHLELDKRVAIKITGRHGAHSGEAAARFRREARATSAVESEHIVDVFDVGVDDTLGVYMVMEVLVGEDLASRLDREGRLDVATTVRLAHQLARGLGKAHAARVVHRDIKPGNVFLAKRDDGAMLVKLLDFGVSVHLDAHPGDSWDGTTLGGRGAGPVGTPLYMSPEQAEGLPSVDARSDLWSVGAILFEALAGRPPHEDRGAFHANLVAILSEDPPSLSEVAPWVPAKLARVVDDLLVRDPAARIADCATLAARLSAAVPNVSADASQPTAVIVASTPDLSSIADELPSDPTLIAPSAHLRGALPAPRESSGPRLAAPSAPGTAAAETLEIRAMAAAQADSFLRAAHPSAIPAPPAPAPPAAPTPRSPSSTAAVVVPQAAASSTIAPAILVERPAMVAPRRVWPLVAFAFGVAAIAAFASAMTISHVRAGQRHVATSAPIAAPDLESAHAPMTDAPKVDKVDAPKVDKVDAPKIDAPKVDAPKVDAPKIDAPKADAPKTDAPKADAPKTERRVPPSASGSASAPAPIPVTPPASSGGDLSPY